MNDLVQQAQAGDSEAFAALFQEHASTLWKIAVSVMNDDDRAADMLQETAIKAWRSIPRFSRKSKIGTWLSRILLNTCFDELRSQAKVVPFEELGHAVDQGAVSPLWRTAATDDATAQCISMDISAAMDGLGADDRLVLMLFYVNDLSIADIAAMLDIAEGAVRTRLSRARARFKEQYLQSSQDGIEADTEHSEVAI